MASRTINYWKRLNLLNSTFLRNDIDLVTFIIQMWHLLKVCPLKKKKGLEFLGSLDRFWNKKYLRDAFAVTLINILQHQNANRSSHTYSWSPYYHQNTLSSPINLVAMQRSLDINRFRNLFHSRLQREVFHLLGIEAAPQWQSNCSNFV